MPRTVSRALLGIVALGALARFATLDLQSFWYDEAVTASLVGDGLGDLLERIPDSESTPPLYYVLAWLWTQLFGDGEVGLRSLSALLGTALIPACFLAARELAGSARAGLFAAALVAANPILVWYSQEARTYSLLTLLSALALVFFARLAPWSERPFRGRDLGWWALLSALSLGAHYFALFTVLPQAVWLLVRGRPVRSVVAAVGAVALAGAALLPLALHQSNLELAAFIREVSIVTRLARLPKQLLLGFDAPAELILSVAVLAVGAVAVCVAVWRVRTPGVLAAAGLAGAAVAIPFVLGVVGPDYFDTRNLLPVWPALATVIAAGLAASRTAGIAGAAVLCAAGVAGFVGTALEPLWQRDDWRAAARSIGPATRPRAIVLTPRETGVVPLRHYLPGARAMPRTGAPVREVVLLARRGSREENLHPTPPPRVPAPGIALFMREKVDYGDDYTAIVLRAPKPVALTPAFLRTFALTKGDRAGVLIEQPGGRAARASRRPGG